ncbi:undecaprenyl-diphosphate phosphatase [Pontimonas sp.]|nr:undecaprenyl-diphosphate phosphatase [Pontimonas sp.]
MGLLDALILGIIQGLTEFLPISSSAHLRIAGEFLPAATDPGATFTAITQIGTELAVLVYFARDIGAILQGWFRSLGQGSRWWRDASAQERSHARMGWLIIVGTLPIVIVGYTAQDYIRGAFRSLWLVATVLIVFGVVLAIADWWGKKSRDLTSLSVSHGLLYGLAQTLALIPGVSRSGATIAMGRTLGYDRVSATRYSFFLAIPAVFGSGLYELNTALTRPELSGPFSLLEISAATMVAFAVALAVIAWLMRYIATRSFMPFVIYRIALGSALMVGLGTGVIAPL